MNLPDISQQVLRAIGMADRQDVAEVTFHFSGREVPQVTVVLEVIDHDKDLGSFFSYLADYYTLVPKELPETPESDQ